MNMLYFESGEKRLVKIHNHLPKLLSLPYLPVILAPFVLLAPVYLAGKALYWGTPYLQFVPWWFRAQQLLGLGSSVLWDPLTGMGAPLIANYQSALFYPPTWLYLLAGWLKGLPGIAWMQAPLIAAHLAWAGLGMIQFAKELKLKPMAQMVGGLAFGLSGYLLTRSGFLSINAAVSWTPWILWGAARLSNDADEINFFRGKESQDNHLRDFLFSGIRLGVLIGCQLLAGHAQVSWYTLVLAGLWVTFLGKGKVFIRWLGFAASAILGVGMAMVQLLPTFEYLSQSQRSSAVDYEFAMNYSFSPWRLSGLVAPDLFGNPARGGFWGYGNYWEDAIYIGLVGFVFALVALFHWKKHRKLTVFLFIIITGSMLLAFGQNTLIFPWLYEHVPTFDMFQAPTRWSLLTVWGLALLGSLGMDLWQKPSGKSLYVLRLATAGAAAVIAGAAVGWYLLRVNSETPQLLSMVQSLALMGFWAVLIGILLLRTPAEEAESSWWQHSVVVVMVLDLLVSVWGLLPGIDVGLYRTSIGNQTELEEILGKGRIYLPLEEERKLKFEAYFNFESFQSRNDWMELPETLLPNSFVYAGIASANNFDPLVPARYAAWMAELDAAPIAVREKMLNLMAVSVVEREDVSQPFGVRFEQIESTPEPLRWFGCAEVAADEKKALAMTLSVESGVEKLILEAAQFSGQPDCAGTYHANLVVLEEKPEELVVKISTQDRGWLHWSEVWYPGWKAWVDEEETNLLRANYLFRAVEVPPGEHIIRISYEPLLYKMGVMISVVTWAAVLFSGYLLVNKRSSQKNI